VIYGKETYVGVENSHERPISIIPKANTYGFLTKKWSPPHYTKIVNFLEPKP
jgi:hypothetical protein